MFQSEKLATITDTAVGAQLRLAPISVEPFDVVAPTQIDKINVPSQKVMKHWQRIMAEF
jgi:hypothetical protein